MGDTQPRIQVTMGMSQDTGKVFYINAEGKSSTSAPAGYPVRAPRAQKAVDWNSTAYLRKEESIEVIALPLQSTIPIPLITSMPSGPIESFSHSIGFRYKPSTAAMMTAAMVLDLHPGALQSFNITTARPEVTAKIMFNKLLGMDERSSGGPDASFSVNINAASIVFLKNRAVTGYTPITELFAGSLTHPGVAMDWKEGPGVYTRCVNKVLIFLNF